MQPNCKLLMQQENNSRCAIDASISRKTSYGRMERLLRIIPHVSVSYRHKRSELYNNNCVLIKVKTVQCMWLCHGAMFWLSIPNKFTIHNPSINKEKRHLTPIIWEKKYMKIFENFIQYHN